MEGLKGFGGLLVLAILWFVLKPLFVGLWNGLLALFTGKAKVETKKE
ncbi:MAG: hypothetical protein LBP33_06170 [Candidatus Adiutrix sp.]|jgi:hypothetical protein|nr:hypothetical protein [Candidatus Adiutrix sp.]